MAQPADDFAALFQGTIIDLGPQLVLAAGSRIDIRPGALQGGGDRFRQQIDLGRAEAQLADPYRADADAGGRERALVAGDRVAIDDDAGHIQNPRRHIAAQMGSVCAHRLGVDQQQMVLAAATDDANAPPGELLGQTGRILDDALLQGAKLVGVGQLQRHRQRGDGVQMRPALLAGKDGAIQLAGDVALVSHQHGPARPAQALVGGRGDDVGYADRAGMYPRGHQSGNVGDVGQQIGPGLVGNLAETPPVDDFGVGRETRDDDLRPGFKRRALDGFIVQVFRLGIDEVGHALIDLAGATHRRSVGQMAAVVQVQAHDLVARLQESGVDGAVGRRAAQRLDVDVQIVGADAVGGEQLGRPPPGQRLDDVGVLDALVIARIAVAPVVGQLHVDVGDLGFGLAAAFLARITFGIDVAKAAAHDLRDGLRGFAFTGDQDDGRGLAGLLPIQNLLDGTIKFSRCPAKDKVTAHYRTSTNRHCRRPCPTCLP